MSLPVPNDHVHVSNEKLSCFPDIQSILCHQLQSTANEHGFQAILLFEKSERDFRETLGELGDVRENSVFLQTSRPYTKFVKQSLAEPGCSMTLSVENYLNLYSFFALKWPLVLNKLTATSNSMSSGKDWVRVGKNLKFLHHGRCVYSCTLGDDLQLTATASSKKNGTGDYELGVVISRGDSEYELPLSTVTKLFGETEAYHFIFEQYKARQGRQSVAA